MKKKLLLGSVSALMSVGFLTACGTGNTGVNDRDGVNFNPVRYERNDNDLLDNRRNNMRMNNNRIDRYENRGLFDIDTRNNNNTIRRNLDRDRDGDFLNINDDMRDNDLFDLDRNNLDRDNDLFDIDNDNDRNLNNRKINRNLNGR